MRYRISSFSQSLQKRPCSICWIVGKGSPRQKENVMGTRPCDHCGSIIGFITDQDRRIAINHDGSRHYCGRPSATSPSQTVATVPRPVTSYGNPSAAILVKVSPSETRETHYEYQQPKQSYVGCFIASVIFLAIIWSIELLRNWLFG